MACSRIREAPPSIFVLSVGSCSWLMVSLRGGADLMFELNTGMTQHFCMVPLHFKFGSEIEGHSCMRLPRPLPRSHLWCPSDMFRLLSNNVTRCDSSTLCIPLEDSFFFGERASDGRES